VALPTTIGDVAPAITRRRAATSVGLGRSSPGAPDVLALLGARDRDIHHRRRKGD